MTVQPKLLCNPLGLLHAKSTAKITGLETREKWSITFAQCRKDRKPLEKRQANIPPTKGLRHVALKVTDLTKSKAFYQAWFNMEVVWEPDGENVYMSSGIDNLALHQMSRRDIQIRKENNGQLLDHLGFLMESPESVNTLYERFVEQGINIVFHPKEHRDGSYSFYITDPDKILIQILYEPRISRITIET